MEQAKLINIRMSNKGKIVGEVQFQGDKKLSVPDSVILQESWNNADCEVKRVNGQITQIILNEKELLVKQNTVVKETPENTKRSPRTTTTTKKPNNKPEKDTKSILVWTAKAPYNFVPLNKEVVNGTVPPAADCYYEITDDQKLKRFTGYIDCHLRTITHLYIRGTQDENALKSGQETNVNPNFFSPGNLVRIPGSSLRGMIKSLVEIVSFGKFGFCTDKTLYYRGLADVSSLQEEYIKNMSPDKDEQGRPKYDFQAGYLKKDGLRYTITPAKKEGEVQFKRVVRIAEHKDKKFEFIWQSDKSCLVISGKKPPKKGVERDWLINPPNDLEKKIYIPEIDIESYKNDSSRYTDKSGNDKSKKDGDLLRLARVYEKEYIPCFYVLWKDSEERDRVSFGHTGYFRLAYEKSIGEHIPKHLRIGDLDMTEAIFGKEGKFASRVFFEDAVSQGKVIFVQEESPKILSTPKPTTFQHYLVQDGVKDLKQLKHWNSDTNIRGNKLYWHKDDLNWSEGKVISDNMHTTIKPIQPGNTFEFRIRFENLTDYELGALLFVLDLPENHFHKLGMGKPLGLGTVKITPKLVISNRKQRYSRLFELNNWYSAEQEEDIDNYKKKFEQHILQNLSTSSPSLWEHERIKQLKIMLDWGNTRITNEKARYMTIQPNEFKYRPVLSKPEDYIKK